MIFLSQTFSFDAAHTLKRTVPLAEFAPSMRVHGHTYYAEVCVAGSLGATGMLTIMESLPQIGRKKAKTVDLYVLRKELEVVRLMLDHRLLDEVQGLAEPTLENLCAFIQKHMRLPVHEVSVWRSDGGKCRITFD